MPSEHSLSIPQMARIAWACARADIVLKYRGSLLGYLWSLVLPALKFLVIYYVFRRLAGSDVPAYPLYLLIGLIAWEHFVAVTSGCIATLFQNAHLVVRIRFPRILLMVAVWLREGVITLTHLIILAIAGIVLGIPVHWTHLAFPLVALQIPLLALGIGMLLAAFALRFRDIEHLWTVSLQVLFWLTPIFYRTSLDAPLHERALQMLSLDIPLTPWSALDAFITFQPLSIAIVDLRRVLLYATELGTPTMLHLATVSLICGTIFLAGCIVFLHRSRHFLEEY